METTARKNLVAALFLLAVCVPFALSIGKIYVDPMDPGFGSRDFPTGVITLIVLLAGLQLVGALRRIRADGAPLVSRDELSRTLRHAAPLMVVGVLYVWLVGMFQYLIPTMLATSAVLAAFGNRGWRRLVVVPLVSAALFHAVFFGLLGLYEAPGSVWEYDGRALFGWLAALFG